MEDIFSPPEIKQGGSGENSIVKVWVPQLLNTKTPKKEKPHLYKQNNASEL
jgi:hypothetical protein